MKKIIREAEMTMQNAVLLQHEVQQLHIENQHQTKKKHTVPRAFVQAGGSLTGAQGLQKAEEEAIVQTA